MQNSHHKCNQCGECCSQEICEYGVAAYKTIKTPCPGFKIKNGVGYCELVVFANDLIEDLKWFFLFRLGIGAGCCNDFKKWTEG